MCLLDNKKDKQVRGVFRNLLNIYDGTFFAEIIKG